MSKVKVWLEELRLPFMTASVPPAILGGLIAWDLTGQIDILLLLLAALAAFLMHAGTNVVNDYFDHVSGCDEINVRFVRPFGGGSRLIQKGLLSPKEVYYGALSLFAFSVMIGLYLAYVSGWQLLIIGIIGLISGFFYTDPRLNLASRGIGEFLVGLNFGTLIVLGSFFVQTGQFALEPLLASLPLAILIAAVLWINEFQDMEADAAVGKRHLVSRLGRRRAAAVYSYLLVLAYVSLVAGTVVGLLPLESVVALVTMPIAARSVNVAMRHYDDTLPLAPANAGTIMLHLVFGIVLIFAYASAATNLIVFAIASFILATLLTTTFISKGPGPSEAHTA
ncbi:MAG: 1,4-dihydroxy-2-naphthoate octaprenyltransferase [Thermoplasmata archaeon]